MTMPDAVDALMALAAAPRARLTRTAYNVRAFAPTAEALRAEAMRAFPNARIDFAVDERRQGIVDTWPADIDDRAARSDWGFSPVYDFDRALRDYLVPGVREKYTTR
jgi:nucleoside-diphosphate-sugar epimerase